eukprot:303204_1
MGAFFTKISTNVVDVDTTVLHHNLLQAKDEFKQLNMDEIKYDQQLKVSVQTTIKELKYAFCKILSDKRIKIYSDSLIIYKVDDPFHATFRFDDLTLKLYDIHANTIHKIHLDRLLPTEYIFQIFIQNEMKQRFLIDGWIKQHIVINKIIPDTLINLVNEYYDIPHANHDLIYIGDIILGRNWSMHMVKQTILKRYIGKVPNLKRMRIRDFLQNRLTNVYYSNKTLGENCKDLKNYKQICCQRKWKKNEENITSKHLLVHCIRWYPKTLTIGPMIEFSVLNSKYLLENIKIELREIGGIDRDNLCVTFIFEYQLKRYTDKNGCIPQHFDVPDAVAFRIKKGDIVVYFDGREHPNHKQLKLLKGDDVPYESFRN